MSGDGESLIWPWRELGIGENADLLTIRRAYAERLKKIDQVREPEAFRRLRDAYEEASRIRHKSIPVRKRETIVWPAETQPITDIGKSLSDGTPMETLRLLTADEGPILSFVEVQEIEEKMLAVAHTLPREALKEMTEWFGWEMVTHPSRTRLSPLFRRLDDRLEAERWYDDLHRQAAFGPWASWDGRRFAARMMLRGTPRWYEQLGPWPVVFANPRRALAQAITHFDLYEGALRDRFDRNRIRWCRQGLKAGRVFFGYVLVLTSVAPLAAFLKHRDLSVAIGAWIGAFTMAAMAWIPVMMIGWVRRICSGWRRSREPAS